jgi:hypothetical protein
VVSGIEPVAAPLPGVAGNEVEAVTVGREGIDWGHSRITVIGEVDVGKFPLPDVAEVLAAGSEFVTPGVDLLLEAATGCVFLLGFGGQTLLRPIAILNRIVPAHLDYGVVVFAFDARIGPKRVLPV